MFASLCQKAMIKHGWPAYLFLVNDRAFYILFEPETGSIARFDNPPDFDQALKACVLNMANIHNVDLTLDKDRVEFNRVYTIKRGGFIAPCPFNDGSPCVCSPDAKIVCSHKTWSFQKCKTKSFRAKSL